MEIETRRGSWRRFINLYRSVKVPWPLYALSLALGLAAAQAAVWLAPFAARVTQGRFEESDLVPTFLLLTLLITVLGAVRGVTDIYAGTRVERNLQTRIWGHLLRVPMRWLNERPSSEMVARVTVDPLLASQALFALTAVWTSLFGFVSAVLAMTSTNGALSLMFLAMVPITIIVFWLVGLTQFYSQKRLVHAWGSMTGFFAEHLGALKTMRILGAQEQELTTGRREIDKMFHAGLIVVGFTQLQTLLGAVITNSAIIIIFVGGSAFVRDGQMGQDDLVLFYTLSGTAMPFLFEILGQYSLVKGTQGFTNKIGRVLEAPQENVTAGTSVEAGRDIHFDDVSFAYGDSQVLRGVTFTIPYGKTTAIVGPNGSGKSTILKLVQRAYAPDAGRLTYGDQPVEDIRLNEWRRLMVAVEQNPTLLSGTVVDNVTFSDRDCDAQRVEEALDTARARTFIERHPDGYQLDVGEEGNKLSGGQRQKVAIARAMVPDPQYLLLDEASSALDRRSDAEVDASLTAAMAGRTVVIVSHRVSTVTDADHIVVMRDGVVQAAGSHEQIYPTCETYRSLIASENIKFPA